MRHVRQPLQALFWAILPAAICVAPAAASPRYSIAPVLFPRYITAGPIAGVDARGEMAGVGLEVGSKLTDCVYFDGTLLVDLTHGSGNLCHFSRMNARGVAVGQYFDTSGYLNYAVLYTHRTLTYIDKLVNSFLDFDDDGLAVGNDFSNRFAVYAVGARKILFELYDPAQQCAMSFPYAINDRRTVFGYDQCVGGNVRYEMVENGAFTYFELPSGFTLQTTGTRAAFNDSAQIALSETGSGHPFLWAAGGQGPPLDLGVLPEDPGGEYAVTALSDTMAVGTSSGGYSWVWTRSTGMVNLDALLPFNTYGWIEPQAVDAQGDIGCSSGGEPFTWLYLRRTR